ncbi:MAG: UDP-N-acetylmuramoyl-tripeptide--D-alanyl-D-alanine ligase [Alistipes sp.]|nr:UDP-N-acetylmuramoyl-tripeptide--D-alanyl-D-alanine ligase [Alistipes sp.]
MMELYNIFNQCTGVTTDSRKVSQGVLFVALRGENFDGNRFAIQALKDGAAYAVIDNPELLEQAAELTARLILVEDTLSALQALAAEHRQQLAIPIIGIVGSNGKTTTKELVSRVLAEKFEVYATQGNLNNHIGVPLTLLAMNRNTEFGVVEMGASAQKEIELLCSISQPNYGIITNIGNAHLEGFGGKEGIAKGKGELFDWLESSGGHAFVPMEDVKLCDMALQRCNMMTEYYSRSIADGYKSHLSGDYNRYNIAAAVAVGRYFGIDEHRIASAIESYIPDNNRSQEVTTERRNIVIIDCYNANPSSMEVAIENISSKRGERNLLILGDMLELGKWSFDEHCRILQLAAQVENAELLLVGSEFSRAAHALGIGATCCTDSTEAADWVAQNKISDTVILLKGSRGIKLEKLIGVL